MASHIECRFNKNSILRCYFLVFLPAGLECYSFFVYVVLLRRIQKAYLLVLLLLKRMPPITKNTRPPSSLLRMRGKTVLIRLYFTPFQGVRRLQITVMKQLLIHFLFYIFKKYFDTKLNHLFTPLQGSKH